MKCKLCDHNKISITYQGLIRNGGLGKYTENPVIMWKCDNCDVIWHELIVEDMKSYYESEAYRKSLEGSSDAELFYKLHDKETLDKFHYTGTTIFRNKIVADIGCGCGAFLDYIKGVAKEIIAVEPSESYRNVMKKKGFHTYAYSEEAKKSWGNKIDVITSFDVIEHVEEPTKFITDIFELLAEGGQAIIGTPTEAPVMRELLGEIFEKKLLFSTQHIWIFSEKNLKLIADKVGFKKVNVKYYQRYGLNNLFGWLKEKEACSDIQNSVITETFDNVWKNECNANGLSDYIVLYLCK